MSVPLNISAVLVCYAFVGLAWAEAERPTQASRSRAKQLIEQLGAENYDRRKLAERQLIYLGHEVIDELIESQYHSSPEVSLASQQLLGRLSVAWTQANDPPIVAQIMRGYDRSSLEVRTSSAEWLAKLEDGVGYDAVARIVRYEMSELVAKKAAIAVIRSIDTRDRDSVVALSNSISSTLEDSQRTPAKWMRALRDELTNATDEIVAVWRQLADDELTFRDSGRSTDLIAATIYRRYAERALEQGNEDVARNVVDRLFEVVKDDPDQVLAIAYWLLDRDRQQLFTELAWNRFDQMKKDMPRFLYCGAEAKLATNREEANRIADSAFALTEDGTVFFDAVATSFVRINTALELEKRGMTEWAIREYKRLMATETSHWRIDMVKEQAMIVLSELLHDRGRDQEAADVLKELIEGDEAVIFPSANQGDETAGLISRMHYFRAEHHRQQADREQQIEFLNKAIAADPTDADVLIAMYRLPRTNQQWKDDTKAKIQRAVAIFEQRLERARRAGEIENRLEMAKHLNQIAWLVGNTEGDQAKAVRQSRRSIELRPESPGSLDTLGRTYFAVGDLAKALKYQRRAATLEPHTRQISRQLAEFESAASQSTPQ